MKTTTKEIIKDCGCKHIEEYNNKNQLIKRTSSYCEDTHYIETYEYNNEGKLTKRTNTKKNSYKTIFEYDPSTDKEIKEINCSANGKRINFIFDRNPNKPWIVKITTYNSDGENSYFYDFKNQKILEKEKEKQL